MPPFSFTTFAVSASSAGAELGGEIGLFLLDALAQRVTGEAGQLHRRADLALDLLEDLADRLGAVMDIGLLEQAVFLGVALQPALGDLLEHMGRLAGVLLGQDRLFALQNLGGDRGEIESDGVRRRDMHGELAAEKREFISLAGRLERDDDADLAQAVGDRAVDIGADHAGRDLELRDAAQVHVLANGGDRVGDGILDRAAARIVMGQHRLGVAATLERDIGDAMRESLEFQVAGHEIGFGIQLDHDAGVARHRDGDQTFGSDAVGLLGGLGEALGAQPVDRGLDITVDGRERGLAVHHARAGLVAEFLHQCGGDRSHFRHPRLSCGTAWRAAADPSRTGSYGATPTLRFRRRRWSAFIVVSSAAGLRRADDAPHPAWRAQASASSRAWATQPSRSMRPPSFRSWSILVRSAGNIAANCQKWNRPPSLSF